MDQETLDGGRLRLPSQALQRECSYLSLVLIVIGLLRVLGPCSASPKEPTTDSDSASYQHMRSVV